MKKIYIISFLLIFFIPVISLKGIIPMSYGARSLSLGNSSAAFNFDFNSIFINPALLSDMKIPLAGYQFHSGNFSYKNFYDTLTSIDLEALKNYSTLDQDTKKILSGELKELFDSKFGMYGYKTQVPGFAVRRYGFSVSFYNITLINPDYPTGPAPGTEIFDNETVKNLNLLFTGIKYTKYSVAYGVDISKNLNLGVSVHYLNGKVTVFGKSLTDEIFIRKMSENDLISYGWEDPDNKFGKLIADLSVSSLVGNSFRLALVVKNLGDPKIEAGDIRFEIKQRIIAAAAFRPDNKVGIYIDIDLKKRNFFFGSGDIQPLSFGIEKLFSNGKFMARAGFMSDLSEHYLFGKKANILYGLGLGINTGKFLIDGAVGLGNDGKVRSLAVSGFYIIR